MYNKHNIQLHYLFKTPHGVETLSKHQGLVHTYRSMFELEGNTYRSLLFEFETRPSVRESKFFDTCKIREKGVNFTVEKIEILRWSKQNNHK